MIKRVLITNRGAIAVRICRTLKTMGLTSIAVYADADRNSLHRLAADEAYPLGAGRAGETYLNQDKLFEIIESAQIDAIHPGYGFLSENSEFVERCEQEGIVFIGPTPDQMRDFGLKHAARALAEANNIPLLQGSGLLANLEDALSSAKIVGYPVMLKSTAGGGGIGMQVCLDETELNQAFDSVKRLSANNFSNDGVFLEKYIAQARHIEVQVFGDGKGKALALGERDCSAQRRHQKVLEETPAPGIPDEIRTRLHDTAVRLVEAVNYRNAGTVEFIYDAQQHDFWFLEVNTRLQVEHGVTEQVYGVDLVEWMLKLADNSLPNLSELKICAPKGWALQARVYAEDPHKQFQPSAGLITHVAFPEVLNNQLRIDHWIEAGIEVSPFFDPMLAKVIVHKDSREEALKALDEALSKTIIEGIETNLLYLRAILATEIFQQGAMFTSFLNDFSITPFTIDVLSGGTLTTVQDYPGRIGYWNVGVPPSGPFDMRSFRLGNRLLGNSDEAAALEITLNGPSLRFNSPTKIVLSGAKIQASLDKQTIEMDELISIAAGQILVLGKVTEGARSYLSIQGGIQCTPYLGSRSTFTLGQFGGHGGRALRAGDVLHLDSDSSHQINSDSFSLPYAFAAPLENDPLNLRVIYGPHGAPDFFTEDDIRKFFDADWEVHYNSSRTGVRLIGPKPEWARESGGQAGMHPSNIHDNAYAIGAIDFTGDMPVILGPDGPSLGGFVCPATVIHADLWKLGQLKAGDKLCFVPVSIKTASSIAKDQEQEIVLLSPELSDYSKLSVDSIIEQSAIFKTVEATESSEKVVYRPSGDRYLLIEYGPLTLDIRLRFRVHALMLWLEKNTLTGILELTPGIRSLQVHYDALTLTLSELMVHLEKAEDELENIDDLCLPSRTVHLPISWNDPACQLAVDKYIQSVRKDAPWCPSNIEFIRRINGLNSIDDVKRIFFEASYVVMGLGDVYLGAPVATPLDPRHRLVTTKYNPARTWTAENSVGIGGSYLCIYGMEGPGGYQFVGRTLQMWNRFHKTTAFEKPWLLRFFDQIKFYEVSADDLTDIRQDFPQGRYPIRIEEGNFKLSDYEHYLAENSQDIQAFTDKREAAFDEELARWKASGQINFSSDTADTNIEEAKLDLPSDMTAVESSVAGNIWKTHVLEGSSVQEGDVVMTLESMKMEIDVHAPCKGVVYQIRRQEGQQVHAGQDLIIIQETLS
ncbi:MAG: urea carboxylase [Oleiphilaceae bacterium]|jgi:urea carboxylase